VPTMSKTCTLDELVQHAKRLVKMQGRTFTRPDDDWTMTVLVVHPGDERPHVIPLPGWVSNDSDAKEALGIALAVAARLTKPLMVALISSTWMVEMDRNSGDVDAETGRVRVMPRDHPDRVEKMFIAVADTEVEEGHFATIKRRRRRPPVLGPWEEPFKGGELTGRLIDPLRQALR
jgi:hypothetical protein